MDVAGNIGKEGTHGLKEGIQHSRHPQKALFRFQPCA